MYFLKLGLLTCAFYVGLTFLFEAGLLAFAHFTVWGVGYGGGKQWFWTLGLKLGFVFGTLWTISFTAAWYIVYHGLKSRTAYFSKSGHHLPANSLDVLSLFVTQWPGNWRIGSFPCHRLAVPADPSPRGADVSSCCFHTAPQS